MTLEPLCFHSEAKGKQILLSDCYSKAERMSTFLDGIVFTNRPVKPYEIITLRILKTEDRWIGGLRVGFTCLNPSNVNPCSLPPFICPDLIHQSPTWAAVVPDRFIKTGDFVHFWVNNSGEVFLKTNEEKKFLICDGVTMDFPVWAVIDVYGTTKAVELLAPGGNPFSLGLLTEISMDEPYDFSFCLPKEECLVCWCHTRNTRLLPCGHTILCYCCANRIFSDTATCPMCRCEIKKFHIQNKSPHRISPDNLLHQ
ncbi:E3 ubiquitin-protein ligase NEURL3 isoform X2 [Macrotis lagotis]